MRIYISHARNSDFLEGLYIPILESELSKEHQFIFPHDESGEGIDFISEVKNIDVLIAEVSTLATGLGIELGIAFSAGVPIVCLYREWTKISSSLNRITKRMIEYSDKADMMEKIGKELF